MERLTGEQKKLIEDNLPFMYWWFDRHNIYNEDTQQDLLYNLCALIHLYDPERGAITTFIDMLNKSKIGKLWKKDVHNQVFEKFLVGLDDYAFSNLSESFEFSYTWQETVGDIDNSFDMYEERDFANYLLTKIHESKRITKKEQDILNAYLDIGNMAAVARMFKVSRQYIFKVIVKVRKEIMINNWLYN